MKILKNKMGQVLKLFIIMGLMMTSLPTPTPVSAKTDSNLGGSFISSGYSNPATIDNLIVETTDPTPVRLNPGDFIHPQQTIRVRFTVSDVETMADLQRVSMKFFYDDTKEEPETELSQEYVFGENATIQNSTDSTGNAFVWQWNRQMVSVDEQPATLKTTVGTLWKDTDAKSVSTWKEISNNSSSFNNVYDSFEFSVVFQLSKIANLSENRNWHVGVEVEDSALYLETNNDAKGSKEYALSSGYSVTWYGEITLPEEQLDFGIINVKDPSEREYAQNEDIIENIQYISNGAYFREIGSGNWSGTPIYKEGTIPTTTSVTDPKTGEKLSPSIPNYANEPSYNTGKLVTNDSSLTMNEFSLRASESQGYDASGFHQVKPTREETFKSVLQGTTELGDKINLYMYLQVSKDFQNGKYSGKVNLKISDAPYISEDTIGVVKNTTTNKVYDSLKNAYTASIDGDTLQLLRRVAIDEDFIIGKNITIDFNQHDIQGNLYIKTNIGSNTDKVTVNLTGKGRLINHPTRSDRKGDLAIQGRYVSVVSDVTVTNNTIITEASYKTVDTVGFVSSGYHNKGIIVNGPASITTSDLATSANIVVNTDDELFLNGVFNSLQVDQIYARINLNADIKALNANKNSVVIFNPGSSVEQPINVVDGSVLTMVTDENATLANRESYVAPKFERVQGLVYNQNKASYTNYIQPAINDANENDAIKILATQYKENLTITKPLTLLGANPTTSGNNERALESIITYPKYRNSQVLLDIDANNVTVQGFTLTNANGSESIKLQGNNHVITSNIFNGFTNAYQVSLANKDGVSDSIATITNNYFHQDVRNGVKSTGVALTFENNVMDIQGSAIEVREMTNNPNPGSIKNNTLGVQNSGVKLEAFNTNVGAWNISNNTINANHETIGFLGVELKDIGVLTVSDNNKPVITITDNTITGLNNIYDNQSPGILYSFIPRQSFEAKNEITITGNTITQFQVGAEVEQGAQGALDLNTILANNTFDEGHVVGGEANNKIKAVPQVIRVNDNIEFREVLTNPNYVNVDTIELEYKSSPYIVYNTAIISKPGLSIIGIKSESGLLPIIEGDRQARTTMFTITADNVTLKDFAVTNSEKIVYIENANDFTIDGILSTNNYYLKYGVHVYGNSGSTNKLSPSAKIINNVFKPARDVSNSVGILINGNNTQLVNDASGGIIIKDNQVAKTTLAGISLDGNTSKNIIDSNEIGGVNYNSSSSAIYIKKSFDNQIKNNKLQASTLSNNSTNNNGIELVHTYNNKITNNEIVNSAGYGVKIQWIDDEYYKNGGNIFSLNKFSNNRDAYQIYEFGSGNTRTWAGKNEVENNNTFTKPGSQPNVRSTTSPALQIVVK